MSTCRISGCHQNGGMFIHIQALSASVGPPWRNLSDLDFVDLRCADLAPSNRRVPGCPVAADGGVFFGVVFFGVCETGCSTGRGWDFSIHVDIYIHEIHGTDIISLHLGAVDIFQW